MSCESWKLSLMLLVLINLLAFARAQDQNPYVCMRNGNYTSNSRYSANLNTLLSSLSSNMGDNGFLNSSVGQNQDRANAIVLCRGDRNLDQCRSCVQNAAVGLVQLCSNQKQAIIWYEFCMLRYSNEPIYGTQTNDPGRILYNNFDVSSPDQFRGNRTRLLDDLRVQAANGSSALKVGAGNRNALDSETLYGLVQCSPDLSSQDCDNCLIRAAQNMRGCCDSARGVRILMPSCNLRYELYPFYNETRLLELQVLVPPMPSPRGTNDDNTTQTVIVIVVTTAVCLIVAALAVIFLRKRMKRRPQETPESRTFLSAFHVL
ncbi:hypothetical protein Pfo_013063 [Paulownia fortunei]|nr:hypothetical protein Pfo_013063 [Paulownia fortunei]